jgi:hypothetical protein
VKREESTRNTAEYFPHTSDENNFNHKNGGCEKEKDLDVPLSRYVNSSSEGGSDCGSKEPKAKRQDIDEFDPVECHVKLAKDHDLTKYRDKTDGDQINGS